MLVCPVKVLVCPVTVHAGAHVIGPTGKPFTENNTGQAIVTRDLLSGLRITGKITGGPSPLKKSDRSCFLQQLDEVIQSIRRTLPGRNSIAYINQSNRKIKQESGKVLVISCKSHVSTWLLFGNILVNGGKIRYQLILKFCFEINLSIFIFH